MQQKPIRLILIFLLISTFAAAQKKRDPFLNLLQRRSFLYFWELSSANGLIPDRAPSPSFSSIAAIGFALTSYICGVERKYITRKQAAQRTLSTLKFLWKAPQGRKIHGCAGYKGFFYHFLDMNTGHRYKNVELSSIDTALLMAGVLVCQSYYNKDNVIERKIRDYALRLYSRVNWSWFQIRNLYLCLGWYPEKGFLPYDWKGYNEAMILYILAMGSPTHPISGKSWKNWTDSYLWGKFHGDPHVNFAPLFGHQYSHIWIDFRDIQDDYMRRKGIDYFENSRRAVYSNRGYCIANPYNWKGYSRNIWGLTACDGPGEKFFFRGSKKFVFHGYGARGASLFEIVDDGTIAPTAAGGSIPFAPEICIPALKKMYQIYGKHLFGKYGFYDAFNLTYRTEKSKRGWFDRDWLGIDNGPIVLMIENYYSELIWKWMKKNYYIVRGLKKAGFQGGWLEKNPIYLKLKQE